MSNKNNQNRYSILSVTSLIAGILPYFCAISLSVLFDHYRFVNLAGRIVYFLVPFALVLVAIVCGIVDIKRKNKGQCSNKGKGLDIAGIILGSVFIILFTYLFAIDLIDRINGEGRLLSELNIFVKRLHS